ncbi:MAG: hypothetical protein E7293_03390 [Lachnospiraceae bacterium]|nr:hypothetical protein [Lachnospiraceae bacterium]
MTVSEAIIHWLKGFKLDMYEGLEKIDTDQQSSRVDSFSLVRAPVQNVEEYLSGNKAYTDHYTFQARLPNQSNEDRIDNNTFGEALERWVWEKDVAGEFPAIPDAEVISVSITTPFYVGKTEDNNFLYQMTIAIKYEKER